jgi:hypothetical protein
MLLHSYWSIGVSILLGFKLKLKLNSDSFENSFGKIQFKKKREIFFPSSSFLILAAGRSPFLG